MVELKNKRITFDQMSLRNIASEKQKVMLLVILKKCARQDSSQKCASKSECTGLHSRSEEVINVAQHERWEVKLPILI